MLIMYRIALLMCCCFALHAEVRPNILWLTSEDNSPYMGCYGDTQAQTPHLDKLAEEGVRYRNAFSGAPVCSAARSTLISMCNASTLGLHHHRSSVDIPEKFKPYTTYFRNAGYYCTNWTKTDYNAKAWKKGGALWDDLSKKAHYKNRKPEQPFFAVFNSTISHEGQIREASKGKRVVDPNNVRLPPYHPDTPAIREDWSRYYDKMREMDAQIGRWLKELEDSGEADNTIVFYYGDHGGALSRGKRDIHDTGTRIPLIIRFGKNVAHLAPTTPGGWVEQPVSFVDFAVTAMSLCDIPIPEGVEGRAFLGKHKVPPRDHVYLFRGRMDERYDAVRAVRTEQYRYVRHFSPHRSYGQVYTYAWQVQHNSKSWWDAFKAGKCNAVQSFYWLPKPAEELYDIQKDPHEINNLADDANFAMIKANLRETLFTDLKTSHDTGLIPEGMWARLAANSTIYDYTHSDAYPQDVVVATADAATQRDLTKLPELVTAMSHDHPVVRFWATQGCVVLGKDAATAKASVQQQLNDDFISVRIAAAEAIAQFGDSDAALATLEQCLASENKYEHLEAANVLERALVAGHLPLAKVQAIFVKAKIKGEASRIAGLVKKFNPATDAQPAAQ